MNIIKSRYQQQYIREARHHRQQQQQLEWSGEKTEVCHDRSRVQSTTTSCSNVYDVSERDDDELKRGGQSPSSDVISSLRHSSCPSVSAHSRPLHIHRPFEDAAAPPQLKDTMSYLDVDKPRRDYRLQAMMVEEPRHGWLAHPHYQLGSVDGTGGSWQQRQQQLLVQTARVADDEAGSSGDSACCDDDDVSDEQVRGDKTINDSQTERLDVTNDDTTSLCARSDSNHYQPQHSRKSGSYDYIIYSVNMHSFHTLCHTQQLLYFFAFVLRYSLLDCKFIPCALFANTRHCYSVYSARRCCVSHLSR